MRRGARRAHGEPGEHGVARRLLAAGGALLATAALAILPATAASAHDYLVSSDPAVNSTVSAPPAKVTLDFDDIVLNLDGKGAIVFVQNAAGLHFETGCAKIDGRDVITPVALGAAGTYTETWRIVSADGHPVTDSIAFRYAPPAGTAAAAGTTSGIAKCDGGPAAGATATATAPAGGGTTSAASGSISGTVIGVIAGAGGFLLLAIIAVVVLLMVSRRRSPQDGA